MLQPDVAPLYATSSGGGERPVEGLSWAPKHCFQKKYDGLSCSSCNDTSRQVQCPTRIGQLVCRQLLIAERCPVVSVGSNGSCRFRRGGLSCEGFPTCLGHNRILCCPYTRAIFCFFATDARSHTRSGPSDLFHFREAKPKAHGGWSLRLPVGRGGLTTTLRVL